MKLFSSAAAYFLCNSLFLCKAGQSKPVAGHRIVLTGIPLILADADQLHAAAEEWATRIAAKPTKVLGWAKKLLHDATEIPRTATLENEAVFIELNQGTEDGKERMAAMLEKRDPVWRGW